MRARYGRWDGTQDDPLGDPLDLGEVLDELGDDLLMGAGGDVALQRLLQRGLRGQIGLEQLRQRLEAARRRFLEGTNLSGPLQEVRERLDRIEELERAELARRDDEDARFAELTLDALPRDPGGAIRELREYPFASEEAATEFDALLGDLRQQILDAQFRDLSSAMRDVSAEELAAITDMVADLNAMLAARARGEEPDFDAFMARHGRFFPEDPRDLDELLEVLARRMAAMSQFLASLSAEQRAELDALSRAVLDDLDLQFQMAQLQANLRAALPGLPWDQAVPDGWADQSMPLSGAIDAVERLAEFDELREALAGDYAGASIDDVDEASLRRALGDDAVRDLRRLKRIERMLEESGLFQREGGELALTPRGARKLGERALVRLLERIERRVEPRATGPDAEATGQTRPWRFGDREPLAVRRTVHNAVLRRAGEGAGGARVTLRPDDFEVEEQEVRPRTATALLLDLSFSMPIKGHFVPAKRMALALHALIEGRYRQDSLHLIGFSDYARQLQPADLAAAGFERVYGTNMQHAFLLARRVLADDPRPIKQVIMVTDGEPTAHLVGDVAEFNWPPIPATIEATLREAMRLARAGIRLHVFLLEDDPGLVGFADRLASSTGGEVVQMRGEAMGRRILHDYLDT
ncbi:MAG: hypothetical protein KY469_01590 [Actinobacteria bacterium]|nr:hypothetical protein [Actinomycetota bacterium]